MLQASVIRHLAFENLGTLEGALVDAGFSIRYFEAGVDDLREAGDGDLLVVLGGPIGVYEQKEYPFLRDELRLIADRMQVDKPLLGICLGAQLMAAALGAKVYAGSNGKEIGWSELQKIGAEPALDPFFEDGVKVLHWHGDTFDLPQGARLLASSAQYPHQAFAYGQHTLALQFHAEVTASNLERWYIGHCCELGKAGISVNELRSAGLANAARLALAAERLWPAWLRANV